MKKIPMFAIAGILVFAACKKDIRDTPLEENNQNPTSQSKVTYDKDAFRFLEQNSGDKLKRDSAFQVILNSLRIGGKKLSIKNIPRKLTLAGVEDEGPYGNANDNGYTMGPYDDGTFYGGDMVNGYNYNMNMRCYFPKRNNFMMVTTSVTYNASEAHIGTPVASVLGNAVGSIENTAPPYANIDLSSGNYVGTLGGTLTEKRTVVRTSNGATNVYAGLNAASYQVGAQISAGVTITESINSISGYQYDYSFTLHSGIMIGSTPTVSWSGLATCIGY